MPFSAPSAAVLRDLCVQVLLPPLVLTAGFVTGHAFSLTIPNPSLCAFRHRSVCPIPAQTPLRRSRFFANDQRPTTDDWTRLHLHRYL